VHGGTYRYRSPKNVLEQITLLRVSLRKAFTG
jgi:hypothetical protein